MRVLLTALLLLTAPAAQACDAFLATVAEQGAAAFPPIEEEGVFARSAAMEFLNTRVFLPATYTESPDEARGCLPAAAALLRPLAEAGDVGAAAWLAAILTFFHPLFDPPAGDPHPWQEGGYYDGLRAEGYRWARAAAEQGSDLGEGVLSHLYVTGFGTPGYGWVWLPPLGDALTYLEARAAGGDTLAHIDLFKLYAFGKHVALDPYAAERHREVLVARLGWYELPCKGYARRTICTTPMTLP